MILIDWHIGCKKVIISSVFNLFFRLTPSLVQVHIEHGVTRFAEPTGIFIPATVHDCRSFQGSRFNAGKFAQGTIGFLFKEIFNQVKLLPCYSQKWIWQIEGMSLYSRNPIRVFANQSSNRCFPNLSQLGFRESYEGIIALVPKPIAMP